MGRVYQTRARSGSASSTRSQKRNRAISTQVLTAAQVVTIAERPCQGCFLRKEKKPHHVCLRRPNRKACLHCRKAHNKCIEIPDEIQPAVKAALELEGQDLTEKVRSIHQKIKNHARALKVARRKAAKRAKNEDTEVEELRRSLKALVVSKRRSPRLSSQ